MGKTNAEIVSLPAATCQQHLKTWYNDGCASCERRGGGRQEKGQRGERLSGNMSHVMTIN